MSETSEHIPSHTLPRCHADREKSVRKNPLFARNLSSDPWVGLSEDLKGRLRARQVDALARMTVPLMVVILVNVATLLLVLQLTEQLSASALIWAALVCPPALMHLFLALRHGERPAPQSTSRATVRRVVRASLMFGCLWAIPGVTFVPDLTGFASIFAYILLTGMVAGGASGLYPIPAAANAYLLPVAFGELAGLSWTYGALATGPTVVACMFLYVSHGVIRRHGELFDAEFIARLETERRNRVIEDLLEDARLEALGTRRMIEERLVRSDKMDAIGQLTGGIAHNFNNLLATIQGNAELLSIDGKADHTLLQPILNGCRAGAGQVQRLLAIAGKQVLRPEAVPLEPLITGLVRVVEPSLGPRFRIRTEIEPDVEVPYADPTQLEGALLNLFFNARDAMPEGGDITLSCRNLTAPRQDGENGGAQVEITLRDTGIGMDKATMARATDPFFSTKPEADGSGLGLSSVAGFARQSRGEMTLDSTPGEGTTVTIRLPAARKQNPKVKDSSDPTEGATVLLVEDMAVVRKVTREMLRSLGFRVVAAAGPEQAMQLLASTDRIDVVLTDILLSDEVTGLQLAREIAKVRPDLPTVFMSGWAHRGDEDESLVERRVLSKPFTRQQLDDHLQTALTALETSHSDAE